MNLKTNQKGFTIVELLIVIVVIAILAAISIVAYSGIQNRAKTSSGQQLASQLAKKVEAYNTIESAYPTLTELQNNYKPGETVANAGPPEARLDSSASVIAPTLTASTADGGKVVSYAKCTTGAQIAYWGYDGTAGLRWIGVGGASSTAACS